MHPSNKLSVSARAFILGASVLFSVAILQGQTVTGSANSVTTLAGGTSTTWTQSDSAVTTGGIAITHSSGGGGNSVTLTGAVGSETLTFVNTSTPLLQNYSMWSTYDYLKNLNLAGSQGLEISTKSNSFVFQTGLNLAGLTGTVALVTTSNEGAIVYAQGDDVLAANAAFAMNGGGAGNYRQQKLVLNGGTTQTVGALSSNTANAYIAAWSGDANLLTGGSVAGTNVTGGTSAATLRVGNDNGSGSFGGIIGSGITTGSVVVTNASTQAINFVKLGSGTQTLTGANTYAGTTTIQAGTLALTGSGSLANSSKIIVANNATFDVSGLASTFTLGSAQMLVGAGSLTGSAQINGMLNPGDVGTYGLLSISSDLTFGSSASATFDLGGTTLGTSYDGLNIGGALTYDGTLTLNFTGAAAPATYNLFNFAGQSGSLSTVSVGGLYSLSLLNTGGIWNATDAGSGYTFSFSQATGDLTVSAAAIPEPSTYAAMAGLLALGLVILRRRAANHAG